MTKLNILFLTLLICSIVSACGGGDADTGNDLDIGSELVDAQHRIDLSWNAPVTRTDGSVLTLSDLEGYRVYYGSSPDELILMVDVNDGKAYYSISNLPRGTYYFTVTAYDMYGLESSFSEIVVKEII